MPHLKRRSVPLSGDAVAGDVVNGKTFYNTSSSTKLTGTLALTGDAVVADVKQEKKFYNHDPVTQLTGTMALTGDATEEDVLEGKTFYSNDPTVKRTGTLVSAPLTGDAAVGDVLLGKTFYNTDPTEKLTGTLVEASLTGDAAVGDVLLGKTFYNTDPTVKLTGTLVSALAEHQNAENTDVGASTVTYQTGYYDTIGNGVTIVSKSIVTTKRCLIVVVASEIDEYTNLTWTKIERGGVNKTVEHTLSPVNFAIAAKYAHLLYATEVLDAGTYQYDLVFRAAGTIQVFGSSIKIVAVSAD